MTTIVVGISRINDSASLSIEIKMAFEQSFMQIKYPIWMLFLQLKVLKQILSI